MKQWNRILGHHERPARRGLPVSWRRGRALAVAAGAAAAAAALWPLRHASRADSLDEWWLRARFGWATRSEEAAPRQDRLGSPPIVLVVMDDACTKAWPEPTILWGPRMASALDSVTRDGARLVALDWTQTVALSEVVPAGSGAGKEAARALFASYDTRLADALRRAPKVVMAAEFQGNARRGQFLKPTAELLYSRPLRPGQDGLEEQPLGYVELNSRGSIVSSVEPAVLGPALGSGTGAAREVKATSFAARIVEEATSSRWEANVPNTLRLVPERQERGAAPRTAPQVLAGPRRVRLDEDGRLLINYALARAGEAPRSRTTGAFRTLSMADVARGRFPKGTFEGAIVIVGATYTGSNDFHYVPLPDAESWARPGLIAGVEIQAHIVRTLLDARPIAEPAALSRWGLALALSLAALGLGATLSGGRSIAGTALLGLLYAAGSLAAFEWRGLALPLTVPLGGMFASVLVMAGYRAVAEERQRQAILRLWGRYQHPRVVDHLLHNPDARGGKGREMQVTVLFADLESFTKTVEHLPPEEAIFILNRYLSMMQECVEEFDGIVDKFLGDGLLAQWGAPDPWSAQGQKRALPIEHHAEAAARACQAMLDRASELAKGQESGAQSFGLRLTLHSGPAIAGWVGDARAAGEGKMEYTVIGDTVNVCSRLQESAKALGASFLVSQSVLEGAPDALVVGRAAQVEIRGRQQPLRVFEILGVQPANPPQKP